jgi:hypothetical protein
VARRPESETILTREQLAEFTRQLSMLSDDGVERIYPALRSRSIRDDVSGMRLQGTDSSTSRRYTTTHGDVEGAAEIQSHDWLIARAFCFSSFPFPI